MSEKTIKPAEPIEESLREEKLDGVTGGTRLTWQPNGLNLTSNPEEAGTDGAKIVGCR